MHPYRPLYILDERAHAKDPCDREEHALVVLLVVLGLAAAAKNKSQEKPTMPSGVSTPDTAIARAA